MRFIIVYHGDDSSERIASAFADDNEPGLYLVGPFTSSEALKRWGDNWQAEHGGDPRWQEIELALPGIALIAPDHKFTRD